MSGNDSRWTAPSSGCCWPTRSRLCRTGSPSPTGTSRCRRPRASRLSRRWRARELLLTLRGHPRLPVRVAAHGEDYARRGHQAVDGRDIVAVGQRGHRVANGVHKVRVRARPHLRQPRAGRAGDIRLHRGILQPREDPLGARLAESRRVRESQLEGPHAGGIGPVNENGADSDSPCRIWSRPARRDDVVCSLVTELVGALGG